MNDIAGLSFSDIAIGKSKFTTQKILESEVDQFGKLSGDMNPLHMDEKFAESTPFKKRVVHGMFVAALISKTHTDLTGPGFVYVGQELNFKSPVHIGDTIKISLTVKEKKEEKGILVLETIVTNQDDKIVLNGKSALMELKRIQERKED